MLALTPLINASDPCVVTIPLVTATKDFDDRAGMRLVSDIYARRTNTHHPFEVVGAPIGME